MEILNEMKLAVIFNLSSMLIVVAIILIYSLLHLDFPTDSLKRGMGSSPKTLESYTPEYKLNTPAVCVETSNLVHRRHRHSILLHLQLL